MLACDMLGGMVYSRDRKKTGMPGAWWKRRKVLEEEIEEARAGACKAQDTGQGLGFYSRGNVKIWRVLSRETAAV